LKGFLGVSGYSHFSHFEGRVLSPAVREINENPFSGKFTVSYEALRGSRRKVRAIRFTLTKDATRRALDDKLQKTPKKKFGKKDVEPEQVEYQFSRPFTADEKTEMAQKLCEIYGVSPDKLPLDTKFIAGEWRSWAEKKGEKINNQVAAFLPFYRKKALEQGFNEVKQ
jgi:hypothetical protein